MDYISKHAQARAKVRDAGVAVEFRSHTPGVYDPETDQETDPTVATVTGSAIELPGDPEQYALLELIGQEPITLFFVPDTLGDEPVLGATVTWAETLRTVRAIRPIRPAEDLIAATVVLV